MSDLRTEVPCLQCNTNQKSVQAHFRHYWSCDPKKAQNKARGKVIKAT
jgi:hypothetical protein